MKHKIITELKVLILSRGNPRKRADILRKLKIFHNMGEHCLFQPIKLPSEPNLVSIGNNCNIAAGVVFVTHDVIHSMLRFKNDPEYPVSDNGLKALAEKRAESTVGMPDDHAPMEVIEEYFWGKNKV